MVAGLGLIERLQARLQHARNDEGISTLVGFVLSMVLLVGSTATVAYYIVSTPDPTTEQEVDPLQQAATRAADIFTRSAGQPRDWDQLANLDAGIQRAGLMEDEGRVQADFEKIEAIKDGTLTASRIARSLDLSDDGYAFYAEGKVRPVALSTVPGKKSAAIGHYTQPNPLIDPLGWVIDSDSAASIDQYATSNPSFTRIQHDWEFRWAQHPSTGVGNTHPDTGWHFETGLIPQLAGLRAVYVNHGDDDHEPDASAEEAAYNAWLAGTNEVSRWKVADNNLLGLPHTPAGNYYLSATWDSNQNGDGWGTLRTNDDDQTWALLGPYDMADASSATLEFKTVALLGASKGWDNKASILFWNVTSAEWQRIGTSSQCGASNWDETAEVPSQNPWTTVQVNLCEAIEYDQSEKVWLAFYWEAECPLVCTNGEIGWVIDDVKVTKQTAFGARTLQNMDFEVSDSIHEALIVAEGVDHGRVLDGPDDSGAIPPQDYMRVFVTSGRDIFVLPAGTDGALLNTIGLDPVIASPTQPVQTDAPRNAFMWMPNELPTTSSQYVSMSLGWDRSLPGTMHDMTVVQSVAGGGPATVVVGEPVDGGGRVAAVAYDLDGITPSSFRDELVANLYASMVFKDPTFRTLGPSPPSSGATELATATRTILVPVTADGLYAYPLEVTVQLWKLGSNT